MKRLQKNRRSLVIVVCIFLCSVLSSVVIAQEQPVNSLTLSEGAINELLQANNTNPNNKLSVDFQIGQLVINLSSTGPRGNTTTFTLVLVPSVNANGKLELDATSLTLNNLVIPINNNPAVNSTTDTLNQYLSGQTDNGLIQDVTVTDDRLVVRWLNNDPNAPTVAIRDTLLSLTYSEASLNLMPWVANPTGANVNDIQIDLQPDVAVINVNRTIEPTLISYEIAPIVVNERVAWQISAQADLETSLAQTLNTIWRAYYGGILGEGSMIDAKVTDDKITLTWDLSNQIQQTDPTATYTLTETEVNDALKAFTNETVSNLFVDMQPEQLLITASGPGNNGQPYAVTVALVPTFENGRITWSIDSMTYNSIVIDRSHLAANSQVTDTLTRELDSSNRQSARVTDFTMTDTEMSMTVNYR